MHRPSSSGAVKKSLKIDILLEKSLDFAICGQLWQLS